MKCKLKDKKNIIIILLSIILIISLGYIGLGLFYSYRSAVLIEGYSTAVKELIELAKNEECSIVPIFFEEDGVRVINVDCLEQQSIEDVSAFEVEE